MSDEVYQRLAKVMDTVPNGFPSTEDGLEIRILKKIFQPEQAELCCDLRLTPETAEQISERTGRPLEGLKEKLTAMAARGQIREIVLPGTHLFKLMPYVVGIYEAQLKHMDREFVEMNDEYLDIFLKPALGTWPPMAQTIPIEEELTSPQEAMPYQNLMHILDKFQSFVLSECICKKEHIMLDNPCDYPLEVCIGMALIPGYFKEDDKRGRPISREEAKEILRISEEAGLVHMTSNYEEGHFWLCNCCGCCCGFLRGINKLGMPAWEVVNSDFYAVIDADECTSCGVCADERCQVNAIEENDDGVYEIVAKKCIGCGLCVSTCPTEAISMVKKSAEEITARGKDEMDWFKKRAERRGVDASKYL